LDKKQFIVLTYDELKNNLYQSVDKSFKLIGQDIGEDFEAMIREKSEKKYTKKHQNKTINDFGFTQEQIKEDFDFVYKEYFL